MNNCTNIKSPTGRQSVFSEGFESPMPVKHPLNALICSLRFGEGLCQGGQEDHQSLRDLAIAGFCPSSPRGGNIAEDTAYKITQIQQKIIKNPSDKTILNDIRSVLTGLESLCDHVGPIGTPNSFSLFIPITTTTTTHGSQGV